MLRASIAVLLCLVLAIPAGAVACEHGPAGMSQSPPPALSAGQAHGRAHDHGDMSRSPAAAGQAPGTVHEDAGCSDCSEGVCRCPSCAHAPPAVPSGSRAAGTHCAGQRSAGLPTAYRDPGTGVLFRPPI